MISWCELLTTSRLASYGHRRRLGSDARLQLERRSRLLDAPLGKIGGPIAARRIGLALPLPGCLTVRGSNKGFFPHGGRRLRDLGLLHALGSLRKPAACDRPAPRDDEQASIGQ